MFNVTIAIYLIASIIVASFALKFKRSFFNFFSVSILLTPVMGVIFLILLGKPKETDETVL